VAVAVLAAVAQHLAFLAAEGQSHLNISCQQGLVAEHFLALVNQAQHMRTEQRLGGVEEEVPD